MDKPATAPHCFGAATVFSHDSEVCRQCSAFQQCAEASLETLHSIKQIVNVADLLRRHENAKIQARAKIQAADEAAAAERNEKPQAPLMKPIERQTKVEIVVLGLNDERKELIAQMPTKVQPFAIGVCEKGYIDATIQSIKEGRNTLDEKSPQWFALAVTSLIAGGIVKSDLRKRYIEELAIKDSSAGPYVSMIVSLFKILGIAQEEDGRVVVAPMYRVQNAV